ncbi:MAG: MmgE/PrpD family protein [Deltaproteobacteria bacterium]|nr:MmgE/PrpD family protein [Deltaproteobacteria bacterium]
MKTERALVKYVLGAHFEDIPETALETLKNVVLTVLGTTIAGAEEDGCESLVALYKGWGGKGEAGILIHGGKVPAQDAAFLNSVMARALDFCDAMAPGVHMGSSTVSVALAAAELAGGCTGREFLTALAAGTEIGARLNLSESAYDGFDPTGVCAMFAATAVAGRILGLDEDGMSNALALAFNRCGGSFQSNIDGSLAVRVIQGWVSQNALICARFADAGVTGPRNFLEGVYGYFHLYGRDNVDVAAVVDGLGDRFELENTLFKKYPSCGLTLGSTEAVLNMMAAHDIRAEHIDRVEVVVPPYAHKLVGHPFEMGDNPRVNAQFSIQYCVASALVRGKSTLQSFEAYAVKDLKVTALAEKVRVISDPGLDARGHTALDMRVLIRDGKEYGTQMDIAPGFPGNPLTAEDHKQRFQDCIASSPRPFSEEKANRIIEAVNRPAQLEDVRELVSLMSA